MEIRAEEISQIIREQIKDYEKKVDLSETGRVLSVGDGIARVYGVEKCMSMELLEFPTPHGNIFGLALNLEEDNVGVAIMGEDFHIGKTAIAVDTIINQKDSGIICIYVAIGQKKSTVAQVVETLRKHGAME